MNHKVTVYGHIPLFQMQKVCLPDYPICKIIKDIRSILYYPWSSINDYLYGSGLRNTNTVLAYFNDNLVKYKEFVLDNADY